MYGFLCGKSTSFLLFKDYHHHLLLLHRPQLQLTSEYWVFKASMFPLPFLCLPSSLSMVLKPKKKRGCEIHESHNLNLLLLKLTRYFISKSIDMSIWYKSSTWSFSISNCITFQVRKVKAPQNVHKIIEIVLSQIVSNLLPAGVGEVGLG